MTAHFTQAAVGHDADGAVGKVPQERREGLLHMENDRVIVRRLEVIYKAVGGGLGGSNLVFEERIEGPLYIARRQ